MKKTSATGQPISRDRRGFLLQPRDVEICEAIHDLRVLSSDHVAALFFPTADGAVSTQCRRRLSLLSEAGYIERREQPQTRSDGRRPYLYFLSHAGRQLLVDELGYEPENIHWQPGYNSVRWPFLEHQLMLSTIHVGFRLASCRAGWELATWTDDRILREAHTQRVTVQGEDGAARKVTVVPDAYMVLSIGGEHGLYFWIEADRGTVTVQARSLQKRSWSQRTRAYQAFVRSEACAKLYPTLKIRVLTVTTGQERLQNLKAATEHADGKTRYWFTTIDELTPETALDVPIWQIAGRPGRFALKQPPAAAGDTR